MSGGPPREPIALPSDVESLLDELDSKAQAAGECDVYAYIYAYTSAVPRVMLYVRDADAAIWEKARALADARQESLSALVATALEQILGPDSGAAPLAAGADELQVRGGAQRRLPGAQFGVGDPDDVGDAALLERRDEGPVRLVLAPGVSPASLLPPTDASGAVGRNTFRAEGVARFDLALGKRFALGGGRSATVRVEAFNVFNRSHFGIPVRLLEAPGFGRSTYTTVPARTLQLAVRYAF